METKNAAIFSNVWLMQHEEAVFRWFVFLLCIKIASDLVLITLGAPLTGLQIITTVMGIAIYCVWQWIASRGRSLFDIVS